MLKLTKITHLIIDMDGVLYLGDKPMPRLVDFIHFLRQHSIQFVLATNNSTRTAQEYVDKLAGMGVTVDSDEILVSGQATARFLARQYPQGTRACFWLASAQERDIRRRFCFGRRVGRIGGR